ncbi:MAG: hypothetical protein MR345_01400 [Bacilli bacterium]|nr:hypothetical protein [Bacilli bacterium]MCI6215579.1 hypothetical protein [Mollicutes bacterium]
MKTICLRFSDAYAPEKGTIQSHQEIINRNGFVWYGKKGAKISKEVLEDLLKNGPVEIVLIKSGSDERYLATLIDFDYKKKSECPDYYKDYLFDMSTWLKITSIKKTDSDILDHCFVISSGLPINSIIKKSMGSYFIVEYR